MWLNDRQVQVLQWIAEGTPKRDWPDSTHRTTAKALQARGLVKVRGHGSAWTATVTERGKRVLAGEEVAPVRGARRRPQDRLKATHPVVLRGEAELPASVHVDPGDLVSDLVAAPDCRLRVPDPDDATRAGYRRALASIPRDLVPTGKRVTHTGRDRGDLVIRLIVIPDPVTPDPFVTVHSTFDPSNPLVAWLNDHPEHLQVADTSRPRALAIIQGVATALEGRGHVVGPPRPSPDRERAQPGRRTVPRSERAAMARPDPSTFEVIVGEQVLAVDLYEEEQRVRTVPAAEAAKLKYEWQRVTSVETSQFSGRLALRIREHTPNQGWADRKRWTLESRLPRFVRTIEEVAQARAEAGRRAEETKRQRRQEWEDALPKARAAYLADLNRGRLDKQLELFTRAQLLRAYADAVSRRAIEITPDERAAAEAWAAWIRQEADRHDPTFKAESLIFVEPAEIRDWELDKYMPRGTRAAAPPD